MEFDITKEEHAYFIGFAQADGHLSESTRNRGKFTVEIKKDDEELLYKLSPMLDCNYNITSRTRDTNFKLNSQSSTLSVFDWGFRIELSKYVPIGKKSDIVKVPEGISKKDYFRGMMDGNGSLGLTANKYPFISLVIASEDLKISYLEYITEITGTVRHSSRNKRDNIYNIMLTRESAQKFADALYSNNIISLDRKYKKYLEVMAWKPSDEIKPLKKSR